MHPSRPPVKPRRSAIGVADFDALGGWDGRYFL